MSIAKEKLTKILEKASNLEKGKEVALAKEFIAIENNMVSLQDTLNTLINEANEDITVELEII